MFILGHPFSAQERMPQLASSSLPLGQTSDIMEKNVIHRKGDRIDLGTDQIVIENLDKVFGPEPSKVFPLLKEGFSKDEILKKTGHTVAINNASLTIEQGEIFVIMGLSGSGKSTLVRCVNRLVEPTRGKLLIDGEDVLKMNARELRELRRKKIGMVFQRFGLLPHRTVIGNVEYGLEIQGMPSEERRNKAQSALDNVGLGSWAQSYPENLSGGMQQRVGLARALANDPDILLMDEAFSALDPLIRKEMQDELLELHSRLHKTILFITHDLDEALKLGNRIAVMKDGAIVQIGTPEEILTHPANDYVADFVQDVDRGKVLTAGSIMIKPEVVTSKDGPRVALRKMKETGLSSVFVVGTGRTLVGIVTADAVLTGDNLEAKDLSSVLVTDVPTTSPDTPVNELFPIAAETKIPISVIDDNRKLLGIIPRVSILAAISKKEVTP